MAEIALTSWNSHVASGSVPSSYQESVSGTIQSVDMALPARALEAVKSSSSIENVEQDYREPICALQDDDWALNDDAEMAYYAIYNTFRKYSEGQAIDDWLIINQALSSLGEGADIFKPLREAVERCHGIT